MRWGGGGAGHAETTLLSLIAHAPTEGYELAADIKNDLRRLIEVVHFKNDFPQV